MRPPGRMAMAGVLALAVALRAAYAWHLGPALLHSDAGDYHAAAMGLLRSGGADVAAYWPPGLPLLLAGWMWAWGTGWVATAVLMVLLGTVLVWAVMRLSGRWEAGLLLAVYPAFVHHGAAPLTQGVAGLCVLGLWGCARAPGVAGWGRVLGAGLALGAAALVRPGSLGLAAVVVWAAWRGRRRRWLLALAVAGGMVGAWQVHLARVLPFPVFLNAANSYNVYLGNNPHTPLYKTWHLGSHAEAWPPAFAAQHDSLAALPPEAQQAAMGRLAWAYITTDPAAFVVRTASRVRCFWAFDTLAGAQYLGLFPGRAWVGYLLLLLDAACWAWLAWQWAARARLPQGGTAWLLLLGLYAAPYFLAFSHPTYHLPVAALLAAGLQGPAARPWSRSDWGRLTPARWLLLALWAAIQAEWVAHMWPR